MLVAMKVILDHANAQHYGVVALSGLNLEMVRAGIKAAEAEQSAIIIQLTPYQVTQHAHFSEIVPLVIQLATSVSVPVALHFDHGCDYGAIMAAIKVGFTSIMFDGSRLSYEENQQKTQQFVHLAHSQGCTVEAKLGATVAGVLRNQSGGELVTDCVQAKEFVAKTGVDALAVTVTTANQQLTSRQVPTLDLVQLANLKKAIGIPLVLTDTSGLSKELLEEVVNAGVNKVDLCTDAFKNCTQTMAESLADSLKMDYLAITVAMEKNLQHFVQHYMQGLGSSRRYGDDV